MAKIKNVLIYESIWDSLPDMSPNEVSELFTGISDWRMGNSPIFTESLSKILFRQQLPLLESQQKNYEARVENGKKGGAPKGLEPWNKGKKQSEPKPNLNRTEAKHIEKEKEKEKDKDIDKENKRSSGKAVLVKNNESYLDKLISIFISDGCSENEALENAKSALHLYNQEEIENMLKR